jgi:hypothetical protein
MLCRLFFVSLVVCFIFLPKFLNLHGVRLRRARLALAAPRRPFRDTRPVPPR